MTKRTPDPRYGANVLAEVARAKRTQRSVALAINLAWHEWRRRTRGEVSWRIDELAAVAAHLGVPIERLTTPVTSEENGV